MTKTQVEGRARDAWKQHDKIVDTNNWLFQQLAAGRLAAEAAYDKALAAQQLANEYNDLRKRFNKRAPK